MHDSDPAPRLDDAAAVVVAIGHNLRRERKRLHLSLQALSTRAGVSFGSISELERGLGNPSVNSLTRLAAALEVPISRLLDAPDGDSMVVRADARHLLPVYGGSDLARQVRRELLTPRSRSNLQLIRSTLPIGFSNEASPFRHAGTEAVVVEQGLLVVQHGERRMELAPGDTVSYRCSTSHWWANGADEPTIVLGAVSPFED